jgi:AcrR family transcriptional regulator
MAAMADSPMADDLKDRIVDAALALAAESSWERLRLHQVAARLGVGLDDIRGHFREKDELVDAWFDRADRALLREGARPELAALAPRTRLRTLLLAWLAALAPQRRVTREMIYGKLEPGHVHVQFAGLLRVSRTVQWWREAAGRDAPLPWRAFDESGLTAIYLATFFYWLRDESPDSARTGAFLDRLLDLATPFARLIAAAAPPAAHPNPSPREARA